MTPPRILVIGRTGQVAKALSATGRLGLVLAVRPDADLTDAASLRRLIRQVRPALVLNAGAYTSVDGAAPRHLVVRVSWILSEYGSNFVRMMLAAARTRDEVTVVNDQTGCPTHAPALAAALLAMADKALAPGFAAWGLHHLAGAGETDRASMARAIYPESARLGGPVAHVRGVPTADYPTPARRPLNARLDMTRTTEVFGVALPDWRLGLSETAAAILKETAS